MGLCLRYQAMPESTALYQQLLVDRRIAALFARLYNYGSGPFAPTTLHIEDLADALDYLAAHSELFESREQVEEAARRLFDMVNRATARSPGLEARGAYIEKSHDTIKERLVEEMRKRGDYDEGDEDLLEQLLYGWGDEEFPKLAGYTLLTVLPASVVSDGAELLRLFAVDALFGNPDDHLREDYGPWREMYFGAAERGEVVLIGG